MAYTTNPYATMRVARHPLYAALAPFPAVCFTLALLTDIAFWQTSLLMWQNFSSWLLFAGLVTGGLAAVLGAIDYLARRRSRYGRSVWPRVLGTVVVLGLAFVNSFVHAGDGWTAVVPNGLILSIATVAVIVVTGWLSRPDATFLATE